jgi:two-component system, sensor histidine kinase and response regulator
MRWPFLAQQIVSWWSITPNGCDADISDADVVDNTASRNSGDEAPYGRRILGCVGGGVLCVAASMALTLGVSPLWIASHLLVALVVGGSTWMALRLGTSARAEPITAPSESIQSLESLSSELNAIRRRMDLMTATASVQIWEYDLRKQAFNWYENRLAALGLQDVPLDQFLEEFDRYANKEDWTSAWALMTESVRSGAANCTYQYRYVRDGKTIHVRDRITIERDSKGRAVRLIGAGMDITAEVEARDEVLRAMESAEQANRAKSEFVANMSHEIRTPMNGIIGMSGLLLDTRLDRTQHDYAATIHSSAESLLTIINDILDFSKIEAGKLTVESLEFDLRTNAEDVASMMAFPAAEKQLELILDVKPDVPARVSGDPQRVRQCLINLVGNAIKFTRSGEVAIEISTIAIDGQAYIHYEVRDTGIGIAADTLATLFQPFVQADSSTTRHFGGTGLGLSIVRRLAEMMGGTAGAQSTPGSGSRFWFRLPLTAGSPFNAPGDLTRLGRRTLVVDDNAAQRQVIAGIVRQAGYEADTAGNAEQAMTMLESALGEGHPFECVIIDLHMPNGDGEALTSRISANSRFANIHRVALEPVNRQEPERVAAFGARACVTKPVRARELTASIDSLFNDPAGVQVLPGKPAEVRLEAPVVSTAGEYVARALLVEDNVVNQKVAVRFLERLGCAVQVANNGEESVHAYASGAFDIIFMDLQMPTMDGLTATRHIRELEAVSDRRTPIIALTANAMTGQMERCLAADMDGFLTKPIEVARLRELLDRFGLRAPTAVLASASEPLSLCASSSVP